MAPVGCMVLGLGLSCSCTFCCQWRRHASLTRPPKGHTRSWYSFWVFKAWVFRPFSTQREYKQRSNSAKEVKWSPILICPTSRSTSWRVLLWRSGTHDACILEGMFISPFLFYWVNGGTQILSHGGISKVKSLVPCLPHAPRLCHHQGQAPRSLLPPSEIWYNTISPNIPYSNVQCNIALAERIPKKPEHCNAGRSLMVQVVSWCATQKLIKIVSTERSLNWLSKWDPLIKL